MSDSFAIPWTVAHQDPLSMGFPRQETGVGYHFLLQGFSLLKWDHKLFFFPQMATQFEWSRSVVSDSLRPRGLAPQAPPSMGFSRQEYWSGLPSPSPGDLPDPGIEPRSPALQADALPSELKGLEAIKWTQPIKAILMVLHRNDSNGREHKWELFEIHFYVKCSLHIIQHFNWALCNQDQISIVSWGFLLCTNIKST